jgi:hypothetical protein
MLAPRRTGDRPKQGWAGCISIKEPDATTLIIALSATFGGVVILCAAGASGYKWWNENMVS